jgi:hypothetical protein
MKEEAAAEEEEEDEEEEEEEGEKWAGDAEYEATPVALPDARRDEEEDDEEEGVPPEPDAPWPPMVTTLPPASLAKVMAEQSPFTWSQTGTVSSQMDAHMSHRWRRMPAV